MHISDHGMGTCSSCIGVSLLMAESQTPMACTDMLKLWLKDRAWGTAPTQQRRDMLCDFVAELLSELEDYAMKDITRVEGIIVRLMTAAVNDAVKLLTEL
jgi:hypothetical protein